MTTREEGFAAWLSMNAYLIEDEFLVDDVNGMPDDPYSEEGLRIAEAAALVHFVDELAVVPVENRALLDKYVRFVGETFVRGLGFSWTCVPRSGDDGEPYIAVEHNRIDTQLELGSTVLSAIVRRTGDEWAFVFRAMQEDLRGP